MGWAILTMGWLIERCDETDWPTTVMLLSCTVIKDYRWKKSLSVTGLVMSEKSLKTEIFMSWKPWQCGPNPAVTEVNRKASAGFELGFYRFSDWMHEMMNWIIPSWSQIHGNEVKPWNHRQFYDVFKSFWQHRAKSSSCCRAVGIFSSINTGTRKLNVWFSYPPHTSSYFIHRGCEIKPEGPQSPCKYFLS